MLAIDFETHLMSMEHPAPKPVCLSWYDGAKTGIEIGHGKMEAFLKSALEKDLIVAHNMKFELAVIYEWFPSLRTLVDKALDEERLMCSKLNEMLLDTKRRPGTATEGDVRISGKYGLADLVLAYFKEDISESKTDPNAWRLRYSELDGIEEESWPQAAIDYAISDSVWSYKLAEVQMPGLAEYDMFAPVRAEHYLTHMGYYGIKVDQDRVEQLAEELHSKIDPAREFLVDKGFIKLSPQEDCLNTRRISTFIKKNCDEDALKLTSAGTISITKTALKKYIHASTKPEVLQALFDYKYGDKEGTEEILRQNKLLETKPKKYTKNAFAFQKYLKENIPGDILKYSSKGHISTAKEHLDTYSSSDDEIISNYIGVIEYEKILTAFVSRLRDAKKDKEGLIRTEYNGTIRTGRTSSRTSTIFPSVNIQQMPRGVKGVTYDVRNCFIPRPGYKICSIDYRGLELASAASQLYAYFGESRLRDAINSGDTPIDLHSFLGSRIMSLQKGKTVSYQEFLDNKKVPEFKELRQISKQVNLGFPGGLGYQTMRTLLYRDGIKTKYLILSRSNYENAIQRDLLRFKGEVPNLRCDRIGFREWALVYDELVSLKSELFNLYPELGAFLKDEHKHFQTGQKRRMMNDFGEWEWEDMYSYKIEGFYRDWCTYTEFCNGYLMQSPSAVGAKKALCNVIAKYRGGDKVNCLAFIHDEIVFEVKDDDTMIDNVTDVAYIMIDTMQTVLKGVRIAVEADIMDYWKKEGGFFQKEFFKDPVDSGKKCKPLKRNIY